MKIWKDVLTNGVERIAWFFFGFILTLAIQTGFTRAKPKPQITPPASTVGPPPAAADPQPIITATGPFIQQQTVTSTWVQNSIVTLGQNQAADRVRLAAIEAKLNPSSATLYMLAFGLTSDANGNAINGVALANATVKGSIFIFTAPVGAPGNTAPSNITKVDYFLDGTLFHTEGVTPFNFNGDGNPWNTATVPNGTHTIKQLVTLTNGTTETDTVTITVAN